MKKNLFFTKEIRNLIYKKILERYIETCKYNTNYGICNALRYVLLHANPNDFGDKKLYTKRNGQSFLIKKIDPYITLKEYPELLSCKPRKPYDELYWFSLGKSGIVPRIEILEKIIKETNNDETFN